MPRSYEEFVQHLRTTNTDVAAQLPTTTERDAAYAAATRLTMCPAPLHEQFSINFDDIDFSTDTGVFVGVGRSGCWIFSPSNPSYSYIYNQGEGRWSRTGNSQVLFAGEAPPDRAYPIHLAYAPNGLKLTTQKINSLWSALYDGATTPWGRPHNALTVIPWSEDLRYIKYPETDNIIALGHNFATDPSHMDDYKYALQGLFRRINNRLQASSGFASVSTEQRVLTTLALLSSVLDVLNYKLVWENNLSIMVEPFVCSICWELELHREDIMVYNPRNRSGSLVRGYCCESCFEEAASPCHNCGEYVPTDDLIYNDLDEDDYSSDSRGICHTCSTRRTSSFRLLGSHERVTNHIPFKKAAYEKGKTSKDSSVPRKVLDRELVSIQRGLVPFRRLSSRAGHFAWKGGMRENNFFLGVELETEVTQPNTLDKAIQFMKKFKSHFIVKMDGSLRDGMEIVSTPCTYLYHINELPWEPMTKGLVEHGCRSWSQERCGMHIHVSKAAFSPLAAGIFTSFFFKPENEKLLLSIAGRDFRSNSYCTNRVPPNFLKPTITMYKEYGHHYYSVDHRRDDTIEVRIFRPSLKANTILRNIEFLTSLHDWVHNASMRDTASAYLEWLDRVENRSKYKRIWAFLASQSYVSSHLFKKSLNKEQDFGATKRMITPTKKALSINAILSDHTPNF